MLSETSFCSCIFCSVQVMRKALNADKGWLGRKQLCKGGAMNGGEATGSVVRD